MVAFGDMRTQTVYLKIKAEIELPSEAKIEEVLAELDYNIQSQTEGNRIRDTEMVEWDIVPCPL